MQLGNRIQKLRRQHGLSQEQLADLLSVSRQSISKWETDAAVPELDKLLKMSEIFGITLDALVREEAVSEQPAPMPNAEGCSSSPASPPHRTAGVILLCTAAILFSLLTVFGGFWAGLLFASPFLASGLICVFIRRHVGLWCGWAVYFLADTYLTYATGASRGAILAALRFPEYYGNLRILIVSWIWFLLLLVLYGCTLVAFRQMERRLERRTVLQLGTATSLFLLSPLTSYFLSAHFQKLLDEAGGAGSAYVTHAVSRLPYAALDVALSWIHIAATAWLFTLLAALIRRSKKNKKKAATL